MAISVHTASSCQKRTEQKSFVESRRNQILEYRGLDPVFDFSASEDNKKDDGFQQQQQGGGGGGGLSNLQQQNLQNKANNKQGIPDHDFFLVVGDNDIRTFHRTYNLTSPNIPREIEREGLNGQGELDIFKGEPLASRKKAKIASQTLEKYSVSKDATTKITDSAIDQSTLDDLVAIAKLNKSKEKEKQLTTPLDVVSRLKPKAERTTAAVGEDDYETTIPESLIVPLDVLSEVQKKILTEQSNGWLSSEQEIKGAKKFSRSTWVSWFRHGKKPNPVKEAAETEQRLAEEERERRAKAAARRAQKVRHHRVTCIHHKDAPKFSQEARRRVREKKFPQTILQESISRLHLAKNGSETQIFGVPESKREEMMTSTSMMSRDDDKNSFVRNYFTTFFSSGDASTNKSSDNHNNQRRSSSRDHHGGGGNNMVLNRGAIDDDDSFTIVDHSSTNTTSRPGSRKSSRSRPGSSNSMVFHFGNAAAEAAKREKEEEEERLRKKQLSLQRYGRTKANTSNKKKNVTSNSQNNNNNNGVFSMTGVELSDRHDLTPTPQQRITDSDYDDDGDELSSFDGNDGEEDEKNRIAQWTRLCSCTPRSTDDEKSDNDDADLQSSPFSSPQTKNTNNADKNVSSSSGNQAPNADKANQLHPKGIPAPLNQQQQQFSSNKTNTISATTTTKRSATLASSTLVPYELSAAKARKSLNKVKRLRNEMESLRAHQLDTTLRLREETREVMLVSNNNARAAIEEAIVKPAEQHARKWARSRATTSNQTLRQLMKDQTESQLMRNFEGKESRCVSSQIGRITPIPSVWTNNGTTSPGSRHRGGISSPSTTTGGGPVVQKLNETVFSSAAMSLQNKRRRRRSKEREQHETQGSENRRANSSMGMSMKPPLVSTSLIRRNNANTPDPTSHLFSSSPSAAAFSPIQNSNNNSNVARKLPPM